MAIRNFINKISGKGQRKRMDDAIDSQTGRKPAQEAAKPRPKPAAAPAKKKKPAR